MVTSEWVSLLDNQSEKLFLDHCAITSWWRRLGSSQSHGTEGTFSALGKGKFKNVREPSLFDGRVAGHLGAADGLFEDCLKCTDSFSMAGVTWHHGSPSLE